MRVLLVCLSLAASLCITEALARGSGGHSSGHSSKSGSFGTGSNSQSHHVQGYTRKDGKYVAPHYQTNPNRTQYDNYSTRGNVNPHTGAVGTKTPQR